MTIKYTVDAPVHAVFRYLADPSLTATDIVPGYRYDWYRNTAWDSVIDGAH